MKKVTILISLLLLMTTYSISFADDLNLTAESAILADVDTGQILYEKNPHLKLHPASTTKIMTGILAIELGNPNDIVTVDDETPYIIKGSHIALEPGEQLSLDDLIHALLIESANDSALVIANHIAGSTEKFVKLMNEKAKELGAMDTNFTNPHGLTDENHLTTAYDLYLMAKYAMENEIFREIVSNYTYTIPPTNKKSESRYLKSENKLLYSTEKINVDGNLVPIKYDGANGIKTGYTTEAGNCLVASVEKNNRRLIAVALKSNGKEVFADIHKLFNYGFHNFQNVNVANENEFVDNFKVENGTIPFVAGIVKNNLICSIPIDSSDEITKKVILNEELKAPIEKGQAIGKIEYYLDDNLLGTVDIISTMAIEKNNLSMFLHQIIGKWYIVVLFLVVVARAYIVMKKRRKKKYRKAYF